MRITDCLSEIKCLMGSRPFLGLGANIRGGKMIKISRDADIFK